METRIAQKKKASLLTYGLIIVGVLLVAAIIAFLVLFMRYRQTGSKRAAINDSQVIITSPENWTQFPAGSPITIQVNAFGQQPITSTELWINGVLEGVQAGPSGGLSPLTSQFSWIPPQGGNFSLVARAVDLNGGIVTSPAMIVLITLPDYADKPDPEAGNVKPVVVPASPAEQSSPNSPSPGDITEPAHEWQGFLGDSLTNLFTQTAPAAPELVVTANGCEIKLNIRDLSENEEGFALYRQTTNSPDWVHATDLASHPGMGWLEYQESGLAGGITYYVTAFNSQGEASSNLALVNIDPQACPPDVPLIELPSLHLEVENLKLDEKTGKLYCYTNLGKNTWSRWPEIGFINPANPVESISQLAKPQLLVNLDAGGTDKLVTGLLDLKLECWAWQNGKLLFLGNLTEKINLDDPKKIPAPLSGASFDILPAYVKGIKREEIVLGELRIPGLSISESRFDVENLGYVPESDQMPLIHAWISYDQNDCMSHLAGSFEQEANCFPMPGYNKGPGGANPQPYLIWDVIDGTCEGAPEKECFSKEWWDGFAQKYPDSTINDPLMFRVDTLWVDENSNPKSFGWGIDKDFQAIRVLPDFPPVEANACFNGFRFFVVKMVADTSLGEITSPKSNFVSVPCPVLLGDSVEIEVEFYSLTLDNIDDGYYADLTNDETADYVYGTFGTNPVGKPGNTHMGYINKNEIDDCYFNDEMGGYGCGSYNYGGYLLKDIRLCTIDSDMCSIDEKFSYNNNKITVTLKDQSALQLFVNLNEWDYADDDNVCFAQVWLGPWPLTTWMTLDDSHVWLIMNDNGDASCAVEVILNALPPGN